MLFVKYLLFYLFKALFLAAVAVLGIFAGKKLRDHKTARMQREAQEVNEITETK
ncbi:MAG: vanadium nitrogenase [Clostridiales bacterium]|nr:vanadium nitrogenase [Clostridiales bacterium]